MLWLFGLANFSVKGQTVFLTHMLLLFPFTFGGGGGGMGDWGKLLLQSFKNLRTILCPEAI